MVVRGDAVCVHLWLPGVFDHFELRRVVTVNKAGIVTHLCAWNEQRVRAGPGFTRAVNLLPEGSKERPPVWICGVYGRKHADLLLSEYRWWPDLESARTGIMQICDGVP